ncbi:VOC family protein [Nocardia arthritidis]|uniref:Glyoxalase/fosfomycin resistance/dioxygenase domain-containing protein n=1 Tax=Nocardia arthritidis TaxID=228602 RepID=A0A6G9YMA1_9NOCA|nr:VOC family protein [Nocardia arthritidis]QIS14197.1 hypothetical protein F5544_31790 [Nocardia arthritidis]
MDTAAPCVAVVDMTDTIAFYRRLGFAVLPTADGPIALVFDGAVMLTLVRGGAAGGRIPAAVRRIRLFGWVRIAVDDYQGTVRRMRPFVTRIEQGSAGSPMFCFRDPNGYRIGISPKMPAAQRKINRIAMKTVHNNRNW